MALVEVQLKVEVPPESTTVGAAVKATTGRGFTAVIVIVAVAAALVPPGPVQVKENVALVVNAPVLRVPLLARSPLQSPEAAHEVAWVELHVSVDALPAATTVGFACSWAAGGALTVIVIATA